MALLCNVPSGFRGIDTDGFRDLARHVGSCTGHLTAQAAQVHTVAEATETPLLAQVADRLRRVGDELTTWSRGIEHRIMVIERVRSTATAVLATFFTAVVGGATSGLDVPGRRPLGHLDLAEGYRRANAVLLDDALSSDARKRSLQALVLGLDGADLPRLVDMLMSGGHHPNAAGALGAAAAALPWPTMRAVLAELEAPLELDDVASSVFAGRLVAGVRGSARHDVAQWLAARPILVAAVVRGTAISSMGTDRGAEELESVVDVLAELDDVAQIAEVVVELIVAQQKSTPLPDRVLLDDAIGTLIRVAPGAVLAQLAAVADPQGLALVPWMQHLIGVERGPRLLGEVVQGVVGPSQVGAVWFADPGADRTFDNAATLGYLATTISIAVGREAQEARSGITGIATMAAIAEILIPAVGRATRAVEVVIPAGLTVGVGKVAHEAQRRVDDSMTTLLERIAERFEVAVDGSSAELARALDVFDERRDALVAYWSERP
jgi:hypothetical protein